MDFSLKIEGVEYKGRLRHPESNRACMLQVVSEAYDAFNVAHNK